MVKVFKPGRRTKAAQEAGIEDGGRGIPAVDDMEVSSYEHALKDDCEQVIREHEGDFQKSEAELRQKFIAARDDYQQAKILFEKKHGELNRPVTKHIPMWGYVLSILAIVVVDVPVNHSVFEILPGEAPMIWALSAILAIVFMIAAHLIGLTARHRGFHAGSIVSILLVIGVIIGLAYLRMEYFVNPENEEDSTKAIRATNPFVLAAWFTSMNILFVLVAAWLSYLAHDEDEHYAQMHKEYLKRREAALEIARKRAERHAAYEADAKDLIEMTHGLINEYRRHNLASRQNRAVPHIWREFPPEKLLDIEKYNFKLENNEVG